MMRLFRHVGSFIVAFLVIATQIYVDIVEYQQGDLFSLFINLTRDKKIFQYIFSLLILYPIIVVVFSSIHNIYKDCFSDRISEDLKTRNKGLVGVILGIFVLYLTISIMLDTFNYEFKPLTIANLGLKEANLGWFLLTTFLFMIIIFVLVLFIDEKFMSITVSMAILCLIFVYVTTSIKSYMVGALIGSWIAVSFGSFLEQRTKDNIKNTLKLSRSHKTNLNPDSQS